MLWAIGAIVVGWILVVGFVKFVTRNDKTHVFHSPESYSYNKDGSLREGARRHE